MNHKKQIVNDWYHAYSEHILSMILVITGDYQLAEDITHDTFVNAYRHLDSFENRSSPKTWLFRIAHNLTVDYIKKKKPIQVALDIFLSKKANDPLPEDIVQINERNKVIYKALQKLKVSYRQVILLRMINGFSSTETAEVLEWSEAKVRTTLHRGLKRLREEILKEGYSFE